MSRLPRASFALMLAMLPAIATIVGMVVLAQISTLRDTGRVVLVMIGIAIRRPRV
jgi:inner membrane transporter RhtA